MSFNDARTAARSNLTILRDHRDDPVKLALYNISRALEALATSVSTELDEIKSDIASLERRID